MDVTTRILADYRELPALVLTTRQAARLWALDLVHCERLLNQLVSDGHLVMDASGQYAAVHALDVLHVPSSGRTGRGAGGLSTDAIVVHEAKVRP